jgi:hypothetical protein
MVAGLHTEVPAGSGGFNLIDVEPTPHLIPLQVFNFEGFREVEAGVGPF